MPTRLRSWSVLCLAMFSVLSLLSLLSLSACSSEPQSAGTLSEPLVAPGPGRPSRATPLVFSDVNDPLGIGNAGERSTSAVIRSQAAYKAAFGHAAPADVKFGAGDVVIFYSPGVQPTGGYEASIVSVVQVGRSLIIATHLSSPGPNCIVTDALSKPFALVKVSTRGRTANTRFQHLRSTRDCEPTNGCDGFECPDGQHCELQEIVCITTPCNPVPTCVEGAAIGEFCGGFAGILCEGNGLCVDDPSDDCDPNMGGADCGGICIENPCNLADCTPGNTCEVQNGEAVCVPTSGTNPCAFTDRKSVV